MNTLQLHVQREKHGKSVHWLEQLLVNGEVIGGGYALNYPELARSSASSGKFWLFTCSCSMPECAGIYEPLPVEHTGDCISWHIIKPLPERHFTFNAKQYCHAIYDALDHANRIIITKRGDIPIDPFSSLPIGPVGFDHRQLQAALLISHNALLATERST